MRIRVLLCIFLVGGMIGLRAEGMNDNQYQKDIGAMTKRSRIHRDLFTQLTTTENYFDDSLNDISFTLYTQKHPKNGQKLQVNDADNLKKSNFDASKPTRLVTHGWLNDGHRDSCILIREAYLSRSDCNVIIVDWSKFAKSIMYPYAVYMVKHKVGTMVATMINFLYEEANLDAERTTLIGHSLGAHVMGIAGYETKYKVNYVVGLDPALPGFMFAAPSISISKESGKHVQIIHTNGGNFGYLMANGHVDFFPNGGSVQPGCLSIGCSHIRAYQLFASSIKNPLKGTLCASYTEFEAGKCGARPKTAYLGGLNLTGENGTYFLQTNAIEPYRSLPYRSRPEAKKIRPPCFYFS